MTAQSSEMDNPLSVDNVETSGQTPLLSWRGYFVPAELHREIATLESDLAALRTQNAILESCSRQRIDREASEIEAARNWRDFCALIQKARGE